VITTAPGPVASGEQGDDPAPSTLPGLLLAHVRARPAAVALRKKNLGRWREYSWEEYGTRSARTGLGLLELVVDGRTGRGHELHVVGLAPDPRIGHRDPLRIAGTEDALALTEIDECVVEDDLSDARGLQGVVDEDEYELP